mgnify:FL=1
MSDEEACKTCGHPPNWGAEVAEVLEKRGFLKELSSKLGPAIDSSNIEKVISSAFEKVKLEPQVKVVHHGLEELENCPTCKVDLSRKYELRSARSEKPLPAVALSPLATAGSPAQSHETFHWGTG